ncbi:hypothetical protein V5799_032378 [Amblyomma americanum]|uniref:M13 family peptidase n=1 Tax=Amblyomma americanum TaxID=6943 RepID=A0AAQ4DRB9_AMBAM
MASTARTRKSRGESSTSPSGTSDSTSTTMFVVNQADFTTTTSEDSSSRQVVQGSSSEVEVNLQQGPTVSGFPSQPVPGPSGYNVFLPIGPSVPVIFTEQGIRIPGYNAPAAVPGAEDDGTTSSTTATEQQEAQDAPVAGIFQLLPAGSYLPTFVNMEQLEEEDEEGDENEELPLELDQEEEPLEEPVQPPIVGVVGASIREQEMFFQMPLQREASPAAWPQAVIMPPQMVPPMMSPPMLSPPMMSPPMMSPPMMPPPMYSHMQAAQMYASPQYGNAWGPWQVQRRTPVAATAEVYPCGHLPQVLQTRDVPPSPPPLSPPPHSPYPGAQGWQLPVVVEHKVGIGGDLLRLLTLRQQQQNLPPDERPGQAEKGVSEGPFAGPAWGSTDGEQDYADQGSSQVEQSSGAGEYLPAGAVLGAAGLAAEAEAAAKTARRSSIETTSNLTRSTKVASILPEVTVACFLLALLLVLVASAALLSWTTRRHARVVLIGQTTKKALHPSNATYIIPPFSVTPADRPLQTINPSLSGNFTTEHTGSPTGPRTYELCATDFCVKEGQMLRYLRDSATDPCKNFYEYVCGQWLSQQPSDVTYLDVDGALATDIEARMHRFLDGPEKSSIRPLFTFWTNCNRQGATAQDRAISHARALGLELPGSQASASPERLMVLAVTLAQEFGLFALLTVELDVDPEGKDQHVLAVDEPELAWGRMKPPLVTSDHTVYWAMLTRAAQPLAALLLTDSRAVQSATHNFARITMVMTNASVAHRHLSDRMGHYRMRGYRELSRLDPLLNGLFGSTHDLRPSSRVLVKAPRFVELVNMLLSTEREALHEYMVLLALLHLAPFLDIPEAPSMFLSSLTGEAVSWEASPPRWRVCLRLAERTLPNLMQMAYEQVFKGSNIFDEVMGDIMVEEVRNGLVEYIDSLNLLDAWSKIIAKIKVRNTKVYTFYPIVLADPKNLAAYVKKLERSVSWDGDIMEYYIRLRGFLAQMKERDETLNFFLPRWKHSIFDPECVYYPRRDVVYVPVGFFNLTVPTSPRERMFHVPRAGPRLIGCFFRAILENTNMYKPEGLWWTEATQAAFQESMACLEERRNEMVYQHRGINLQDASRGLNLQGLSDIEDNVAVRISAKVYDDQLFTNRYLNRDYRLPGVEHLTSKQLFFIYLARSHCEAPSVEKSLEDIRCSYKSKGRYR